MSALYQNLTVGETYTTGQVLRIMKSVPDVNHGGWIGHLNDADRNAVYDKKTSLLEKIHEEVPSHKLAVEDYGTGRILF